MMGGGFLKATGRVIVGGSNMTTAGTVIETGITTGTATITMTDTSHVDRRKKQLRKRSPDAMS